MQIEVLKEDKIKELSEGQKQDYFIEMQRFVIRNLNKEDRTYYRQSIEKIESLENKIKFLNGYYEIAKINELIKESFEFIKKYYSDQYEEIKREYDNQPEQEQIYFLQSKIMRLKESLPYRLSILITSKLEEIKKQLRETEYIDVIYALKQISLDEEKYDYLLRIDRKKEKQKRIQERRAESKN